MCDKTDISIYMQPLHGKCWLPWLGSSAGALGMTLILFCVMPAWLHSGSPPALAPILATQVNVIRLPRPDTPVLRKTPKPQESEPAKLRTLPQAAHRPLPNPNLSLPFEINSKLTGGPETLEVPPMAPGGANDFGLPDIFAAGDLDQPLITLTRLPPVYPFRAKQRNIQGWVKVRFVVTTQGTVERATIVEAQPPGVFDHSVIRCVTGWRFRPGTIEGQPVNTWAETIIKFELK
jgi:protein TonB